MLPQYIPLDAVHGLLHAARYVSIYGLRKKMGQIILVKMITHFTPNLTLRDGLSRINTIFSASVSLRFNVSGNKIKRRR